MIIYLKVKIVWMSELSDLSPIRIHQIQQSVTAFVRRCKSMSSFLSKSYPQKKLIRLIYMLMKYLKEYNEFESTDKWWEVENMFGLLSDEFEMEDLDKNKDIFGGYIHVPGIYYSIDKSKYILRIEFYVGSEFGNKFKNMIHEFSSFLDRVKQIGFDHKVGADYKAFFLDRDEPYGKRHSLEDYTDQYIDYIKDMDIFGMMDPYIIQIIDNVNEVNESTKFNDSDRNEVIELFKGYFDELDIEDNFLLRYYKESLLILVNVKENQSESFEKIYKDFINQLNNIGFTSFIEYQSSSNLRGHRQYRIEIKNKFFDFNHQDEYDNFNESSLLLPENTEVPFTDSDKDEVLELFNGYFDAIDVEDDYLMFTTNSSLVILVTIFKKDYIMFGDIYKEFIIQLDNMNMSAIETRSKWRNHIRYRIEIFNNPSNLLESISSDKSASHLSQSDLSMIQDVFSNISDEKDIVVEYLGVVNQKGLGYHKEFTYVPIYKFSFTYPKIYTNRPIGMHTRTLLTLGGGFDYSLKEDIKKYMLDTINKCLSIQGDIIALVPEDFLVQSAYDSDITKSSYTNTIGICLQRFLSYIGPVASKSNQSDKHISRLEIIE